MNIQRIFILITFIFLTLSFLIFQSGFWLYVDSAWWPMDIDRYKQLLQYWLHSFSNITYFGFDGSTIQSSRLLQTFTKILPMELFYVFFFLGSFLSSYYVLCISFSKKASFYWALLFTFNPVSLYFLKQVWYTYSYFSLPLIILSVYYLLKTNRLVFVFWLTIGVYLFSSYTRLTWIYWLFLLILSWYYYKNIFHAIKTRPLRFVSVSTIVIVINFPFIFSILFPYLNGDKAYFSWLWNYANSFDSYQQYFYNRIKSEPFIESFYVKEIVNEFWSSWQKWIIFVWVSLILIFANIFSFALRKDKDYKKNALTTFLLWLLFLTIFIKAWAEFMPEALFSWIAYTYFPFIANNTLWLYLLYIPILVYIFTNNLDYYSSRNKAQFFILWWIAYVFISIFPLLPFHNNAKTQLVDIYSMPQDYIDTLYTKNTLHESTVFFPHETLYLEWNPYHIKLHNNVNYELLFHWDIRSVNQKQQTLKDVTYDILNYENTNLSLFNLKSIFVFKNIVNIPNGTFDWYLWEELKEKSEYQYQKFLNNRNYMAINDNESFTNFQVKNAENFEYFIYSPQTIINSEIDTFFDEEIDINSRPVVIDSESFKKPEKIDFLEVPESNQNIKIDYKRSTINPTKYYLKLSNVDTSDDFLVQLNQTFWMSWKLKWIDEEDFRQYNYKENYEFFPITNNSFCYTEWDWYLDSLWDYKYLPLKEVKDDNHFEGNFVGNTWLVEPDDIRQEDIWKDELYAVIIYEKQLWYIWSIVISLGTLWLLIILSIIQEFYLYRKSKKWKKTS